MQNRGGGHGRIDFILLPAECRGHKHANAHRSWILYLDADLAGSQIRIQNRKNIANSPFEYAARICVESDFSGVAGVNVGKVVFVDIANNPDRKSTRLNSSHLVI